MQRNVARAEARAREAARGDGERGADRVGAHRTTSSRGRASAAGAASSVGRGRRPVRVRNTSSREGSRTAAVAGSRPRRRARGRRRSGRACRRSRSGARARAVAGHRAEVEPLEDAGRHAAPRPRRASSARARCAPRRRFSSAEVPSARTRAAVDHHDAVGQQVGLLEVLGGQQHRGAVGHQAPHGVPEVAAARPGRGRWWARPGTGPAAGGRARRPGRGAGACRRSRCAPARSRGVRRARSARAARRRAGRSRGAAGGSAPPIRIRFSRPVRLPSTAANCPASPMRVRTRSGWRATSMPSTRASPRVGLEDRGEDADGGGLARAVGPEQARAPCPAGTARSTPSRARTSP